MRTLTLTLSLFALILIAAGCAPAEAADVVVFYGARIVVSVATGSTDPYIPGFYPQPWLDAGWDISTEPAPDPAFPPEDCTLRPLAAPGQWLGICPGEALVPFAGANYVTILVMDQDYKQIQVIEMGMANQ